MKKKDLCLLERIPVSIDGRQPNALIDFCAEFAVVREDIVQGLSLEGIPAIYIKGIFCPK